jgi:hypothetical protein
VPDFVEYAPNTDEVTRDSASDDTSTQSSKTSRIYFASDCISTLWRHGCIANDKRGVAAVVSASTAARDTNEDVQERLPPFTIFNV